MHLKLSKLHINVEKEQNNELNQQKKEIDWKIDESILYLFAW